MTSVGTYTEIDGRPAVVFERRLAHPVDRVWRAITDLDELARWFPDSIDGDISPGGKLTFHYPEGDEFPDGDFDGEVLELVPPHRFHLRWGTQELRLQVEPAGEGSILRLTNLLDQPNEAARNAAGWELCLASLEALVDDVDVVTAHGRAHYRAYVDRGMPTGAGFPGVD